MRRIWIVAVLMVILVPGWAGSAEDRRRSDIWLESRLVTTYTLNEHLNPFDLDVEVNDGVAHLAGTVDSPVEKDLAVEIARGVEGIREVRESITVDTKAARGSPEPAKAFRRTVQDATITAKVKSRLLWNQETAGLSIDVGTDQGVVRLKGTVGSDVERDLARQIAANTSGVRKVEVNLRVAPEAAEASGAKHGTKETINDAWITTKVKTSLVYQRGFDGLDVNVDTADRIVTLKGTVATRKQKEAVLSLARNTVGVEGVRDELEVTGQ